MADTSQYLKAVGASLSQDGESASLDFQRQNGTVAYVHFPTAAAGSIVSNILLALGTLFGKQRQMIGGQDPRVGFALGALKVSKIQGGVAVGGVPVQSLVLETGLRLDFGLPGTLGQELADWAQGLVDEAKKPSPPKH